MITNYIEGWFKTVVSRSSGALEDAITVEGLQDRHLGPRSEYAKVIFRIEPSDHFEAVSEIGEKESHFEGEGYLNAAIHGFLDVALVGAPTPLRDVKLVLVDAIDHEVDSSVRAFRMAGRDAATRLLKQLRWL